jgi:hypothetical protein
MGIRHIPTGIQIRLHIPGKAFMVTELNCSTGAFSGWHYVALQVHHLGLGKNLPAGLQPERQETVTLGLQTRFPR